MYKIFLLHELFRIHDVHKLNNEQTNVISQLSILSLLFETFKNFDLCTAQLTITQYFLKMV